ncbi:MAG: hypothetical protein RLZZ96_525 [Bacteroidota bacterium]|jgi:hypothetical protein
MNLKEIGTLLLCIFLFSTLLIGYKYYIARGKVFKVSRLILLKYSIRLLLLISLLSLCFYSLDEINSGNRSTEKVETIMFVISGNASSLTWNKLLDDFKQRPQSSYFGLVLYNSKRNFFEQIIPPTNYESFLNLLEQSHSTSFNHEKHIFQDQLRFKPADEEFISYRLQGTEWVFIRKDSQENSLFSSKNSLSTWIGNTFAKVYIVIAILFLLFIDIVFTTKAIKI